jgi:hypothetical protein
MGGLLVSMHLGGAHDGRRAARVAFAFAWEEWSASATWALLPLPHCDSDGARAHFDRELARADVVPMHRMQRSGRMALPLIVRRSSGPRGEPSAADCRFRRRAAISALALLVLIVRLRPGRKVLAFTRKRKASPTCALPTCGINASGASDAKPRCRGRRIGNTAVTAAFHTGRRHLAAARRLSPPRGLRPVQSTGSHPCPSLRSRAIRGVHVTIFHQSKEAAMATGPMQFGADNNAGPNQPNQTILRAQNSNRATLEVRNEPTSALTAGGGLTVQGGPFAVRATGGQGSDLPGIGVHGVADGTGVIGEGRTGVFGNSVGGGNGVWGRSPQANGVQGVSGSYNASGVYGQNNVGGWGVAGRTFGLLNSDRAAVLGESLRDPSAPTSSPNGKAAGVLGYSETGYGGVFITGQAGSNFPWVNSGGLRVVGEIVKTQGEYSEALPHPDGSQRLLYAPLSPESWYEDYGRAQLVEGRAEVELDADFVAVLGIDDGSYHVFLTPEGDTSGLYVSGRDARAFTVREQHNGTGSVEFSYRVVTKNKHRQPKRLARLEEPEELIRPPQFGSQPTGDRPDSSVYPA